jgi:hypothetical protein
MAPVGQTSTHAPQEMQSLVISNAIDGSSLKELCIISLSHYNILFSYCKGFYPLNIKFEKNSDNKRYLEQVRATIM